MRRWGHGSKLAVLWTALALGAPSLAAAKDPLDDEPQPISRPYHPGTLGLGFTVNPFFFIDPLSGLGAGPTVKVFLPKEIPLAFQATIGYGGIGGGSLGLQLDALYESPRIHEDHFSSVNWYAGIGGNFGLFFQCAVQRCTSGVFGVHSVIGLGWLFNSAPVEITADWRPGFVSAYTAYESYQFASLWAFSAAGRYFF